MKNNSVTRALSGGHTTEITRLLAGLDPQKHRPLVFVAADNDARSLGKIAGIRAHRVSASNPHDSLDSRVSLTLDRAWQKKMSWCVQCLGYVRPSQPLALAGTLRFSNCGDGEWWAGGREQAPRCAKDALLVPGPEPGALPSTRPPPDERAWHVYAALHGGLPPPGESYMRTTTSSERASLAL
jgi:hypothetical protein